jgi:hypothetical protein
MRGCILQGSLVSQRLAAGKALHWVFGDSNGGGMMIAFFNGAGDKLKDGAGLAVIEPQCIHQYGQVRCSCTVGHTAMGRCTAG